jgi:hypothetical protein
MEPGTLAGDARCSPTSSWWALETLVTWAWLDPGKRPIEEHSGGGGTIGGEIGPPPPPQVSFDTVRYDGHKNSKRMLENGGGWSTVKGIIVETLPFSNRLATIDGGPTVAGYGSCGRFGTKGINPARRGAIEKKKACKSRGMERAVVVVQGRARRQWLKAAAWLRTPRRIY